MTKVINFERRSWRRHSSAQTAESLDTPPYAAFDQLDGTHPWQQDVPNGYINYPVRQLPHGKVSYFNWELAKEMGLIEKNHPHRLNKILEEKLLETFCIRIINEWDQTHHIIYPPSMVKRNPYMATRYLQLQHSDKSGRTSGDGRCIWNGVVRHQGKIWDVSSRGTGVTALAPGSVSAGKPLKSGNHDHGYGCGMAEIDELYAAAMMAEIFHKKGLPTERILALIDLGKGVGIGVRAGLNLIRPAHLFSPLRQGQWDQLQKATDYLISRQFQNQAWTFSKFKHNKYDLLLKQIVSSFAKLAAHLEREYIFAWLDWDGDNVLASGGLIDYGSIRQFGLRHDQYRYDDVDRFSTSLNQQKAKARTIVQTFAQLTDFLNTQTKKPLDKFRHHPCLKQFDRQFQHFLLDKFLHQVGFNEEQSTLALHHSPQLVRQLFKEFSFFERFKTHRKLTRVADGVNRPAIFNMRTLLRELPTFFLQHVHEFTSPQGSQLGMPAQEFFNLILSDLASGRDRHLTVSLIKRITRFQYLYKKLLKKTFSTMDFAENLKQLKNQAERIHRPDRLTGNALIYIVDELLQARAKGFSDEAIQNIMTAIIEDQTQSSSCSSHDSFKPGLSGSVTSSSANIRPKNRTLSTQQQLLTQVLSLVKDHKEEI